jgi:hypothetical protein
LDSLGLKEKFSKAGLNMGSMNGIMGLLGPLVLGGIAAKALGGNRRGNMGGMGGGLMGGVLGGLLGGGGGRMMGGMGGLGSLISGINRSRHNRSIGGLLGRFL